MRLYKKDLLRKPKFEDFVVKQKDFLFIEDGYAIFASKKILKGSCKIALRMNSEGIFAVGSIIESCVNFQITLNQQLYPGEIKWIQEKLKMVEEYVKND